MLSAKAIIEAAVDEPDNYICVELENGVQDVELEGNTMTLFTRFSSNQASLWKLMCRQANDFFPFVDEYIPTAIGQSSVERHYSTPADSKFGVILSNNLIDGQIALQITMYLSERALDSFLQWEPSPAGCCKKMVELLKMSEAERSQKKYYHPGALLGDYSC